MTCGIENSYKSAEKKKKYRSFRFFENRDYSELCIIVGTYY
ncbi:hypothetical protein H800_YJM1342D00239 [Saccharomyces cerevisiae YJM1342]|nr:hypothetical protein H800_YJM1342D00239 [Saccharomyces cerevisiae YJM1342]